MGGYTRKVVLKVSLSQQKKVKIKEGLRKGSVSKMTMMMMTMMMMMAMMMMTTMMIMMMKAKLRKGSLSKMTRLLVRFNIVHQHLLSECPEYRKFEIGYSV